MTSREIEESISEIRDPIVDSLELPDERMDDDRLDETVERVADPTGD